MLRVAGLCANFAYACLIVWIYTTRPSNFSEMTGSLTSAVGAYHVNRTSFDEALRFFRHDQFIEARAAFARADPARQDPMTQFYIAYSFYRQGWGRVYNDDALFRQGIETIERAVSIAPDQRIRVEDPDLGMHTADELRAELLRGVTREAADLNPLRIFKERK